MTLCLEDVRRLAVPIRRKYNYSVWSSSSKCCTGTKSAIYDLVVLAASCLKAELSREIALLKSICRVTKGQ